MTTEHAVVIAGAGPTGLMLAGELALAGIDVAIVERRPDQELVGQRALGFHARTIEVFDQRGIADRFIPQALVGQHSGFAWIHLDMSDLPTRHNYSLGLAQQKIEPILADWVDELGVPIYREREITGFEQDDAGVDIAISDGEPLRAQYLAGCDGGRSVVRKAAGIDFPGWDATVSSLIAEVEMDEEPEDGLRREGGLHALSKPNEHGLVGLMLSEERVGQSDEPNLQDVREGLIRFYGKDFGLRGAKWISRFTDSTRQAASYRDRRVLLAGDAAHVHHPMGGQGLSVGVQDAVNLGWKLAQVVKGTSPNSLLDTYHDERHPVAARVLHNTMAQIALSRIDERTDALRDTVAELLAMDEPRKRIAAMMVGLDIHYDLGEGHPLLGRRMPDLDLVTAEGTTRVFALLHEARPVLVDFGEPGSIDIAGWSDRVKLVEGEYKGTWELPVLGEVSAPDAVLIRPDGHVAWVGEGSKAGLCDALTAWFGLPSAA